ncbi:MAG: sugar ABC transporter permease [Eubacteriales bacterium]|nr:sugar ABC transporter permease [Eubacteriales bacterium]
MKKTQKKRLTGLERTHTNICRLMLIPAFILCFVFVIVPLFDVIAYSFTDWDGIQPEMNFVGLENYRNLPQMEGFKDMLIATFTFAIGMTALTILVAFLTALVLDKKGRGRLPRSLVRALWFIPSLLSGTVVGILWHIMYNYHNGVINTVIKTLGGKPVNWLETYGITNIAIIIAAAWVQIGMCIIVFMAGLQSISSDIYEAATIDGATGRQQLLSITVPMMAPSITINVITTTIGAFKAYELPYFISKGLPGYTSLLITGRISFYAFNAGKYGYGSALAVVLILIIAVFSLIELVFLRKREDIYG